jgi:hypothetical protein
MIATMGAAHIESLSDIVEADPLALAAIMGVTYANARRMQFLARAAEPKAEEMAEPPVSIDASAPASESSSVSLSFDARWGESAPSSPEENSADPAPMRKFWEPQPSSAVVTPDPSHEELVIEMRVPEVEASDASSGDVSAPEEYVSEEWSGEDAKPEATPEPTCEPSDDLGPKSVPAPEPPMPEAATYGTPWPQDSGPELTSPLHVRFPSEPDPAEAVQAENASDGECDSNRPLNWNFDLTGPSTRFPDNAPAPSEPHSGIPGDSASGDPAVDPGSDGVGGPFA